MNLPDTGKIIEPVAKILDDWKSWLYITGFIFIMLFILFFGSTGKV